MSKMGTPVASEVLPRAGAIKQDVLGDSGDEYQNETMYDDSVGGDMNIKIKYKKSTHIPGVPAPDPLPIWMVMPLSNKLPMIRGPKKSAILYTTDIGEQLFRAYPGQEFDLTDPNNYRVSSDYKPLNDPHLKPMLRRRRVRNTLEKRGFITPDGKVICSLKEFNEYRRYLQKFNNRLAYTIDEYERFRETPEMSAAEKRIVAAAEEGRKRAKKVEEMRARLEQKREDARRESIRLQKEEAERQRRWERQERERLRAIAEANRLAEQRRSELLVQQRIEERNRQLAKIKQWDREDKKRSQRLKEKTDQAKQDHILKLDYHWEERKLFQQKALDEETENKATKDAERERNLLARVEAMEKLRAREQERNEHAAKQRQKEKARVAEIDSKRYESRLSSLKEGSSKRRRQTREGAAGKMLKSYWDLEIELQKEMKDRGFAQVADSDFSYSAPSDILAEQDVYEEERIPDEQVVLVSETEGSQEMVQGQVVKDERPRSKASKEPATKTSRTNAEEIEYEDDDEDDEEEEEEEEEEESDDEGDEEYEMFHDEEQEDEETEEEEEEAPKRGAGPAYDDSDIDDPFYTEDQEVDSVTEKCDPKARLSQVTDSYHQHKRRSEDEVSQLAGTSADSMVKESRKTKEDIDVGSAVLSNELIAVLRSLALDDEPSEIQAAAENALRRLCWDVTVAPVLERVIQRIDDNANVIGLPNSTSAEPVLQALRQALASVAEVDEDEKPSNEARTKPKMSLKQELLKLSHNPLASPKTGSIKSKKSEKSKLSSPASLPQPAKNTSASRKHTKERLGGFVQGTLAAIQSSLKMETFSATNAITLTRKVCTADGVNEEFIDHIVETYRSGADVVSKADHFSSDLSLNYQSASDKSRLISRDTLRAALSRGCGQCKKGGRSSDAVAVRMALHTLTLLPKGGPIEAQATSLVVYIIHELIGEIGVKVLQRSPVEESVMCKFVGSLFCARKPTTFSDASLDPDLDSSSAEWVQIEPVLHDRPISLDSNLVNDTLSILSIKRDVDFEHAAQQGNLLVERNSFRSLIHPEISRVPRLNGTSEKAVCARYMQLSRRRFSLQPGDEHPEEQEQLQSIRAEQQRRRSLGSEQSELSDEFADLLRNRPRVPIDDVIVESEDEPVDDIVLNVEEPNHNGGPSAAPANTAQASSSSKSKKGQARATGKACTTR